MASAWVVGRVRVLLPRWRLRLGCRGGGIASDHAASTCLLSVCLAGQEGQREADDLFVPGQVLEQLVLHLVDNTVAVRGHIVQSASCRILVGVLLAPAVDLSQRVELSANVLAVLAHGTKEIDPQLVLGVGVQLTKLDLGLDSLARELNEPHTSGLGLSSDSHHVADTINVLLLESGWLVGDDHWRVLLSGRVPALRLGRLLLFLLLRGLALSTISLPGIKRVLVNWILCSQIDQMLRMSLIA